MTAIFKPKKRRNIEKITFFSYNSKVNKENLKEHLSWIKHLLKFTINILL